jgi:hypothetical protein
MIQGRDELDAKTHNDITAVAIALAKTSRINCVRMKSMGLLAADFDPESQNKH